jgi:hypothetical protein
MSMARGAVTDLLFPDLPYNNVDVRTQMRVLQFCICVVLLTVGGPATAIGIRPYLQMPMDLYPPEALAADLQGDVEVTLIAGADGKVEACLPKGSDDLALLKAATCTILTKRIHFQANAPSPQNLNILVEWRIWTRPTPGTAGGEETGYGGAIPIAPRYWVSSDDYPLSELGRGGATSVIFEIGIDGRATGCKTQKSSGSIALDIRTCKIVEARARFIPAFGEDGLPRATTGHHRLIWRK